MNSYGIKKFRWKISVLALFVVFFLSPQCNSADLEISYVKGEVSQEVAAGVLTHIYARAGISVKFVPLPSKRALELSSTGVLDGETQRIFGVGEQIPALVRIPTPYMTWNISVFTKHTDIVLEHWEQLSGRALVANRGFKFAENLFASYGAQKIHFVHDTTAIFQFLNLERAEFGITSLFDGLCILKQMKNNNIKALKKPHTHIHGYHYLHKKNKSLVNTIDKVIREMEASGELLKLNNNYRQKVYESVCL